MEETIDESSELIQSSGGVFEVQDGDTLIYSKKLLGRFPEDGEILSIVSALKAGVPLEEAQKKAGENSTPPLSFVDWVKYKMTRK